jgi:hypothetical protein
MPVSGPCTSLFLPLLVVMSIFPISFTFFFFFSFQEQTFASHNAIQAA